jgi:hypothetical protein
VSTSHHAPLVSELHQHNLTPVLPQRQFCGC